MKESKTLILIIFVLASSCLPMMVHPDFSVTLINNFMEPVQVFNSEGQLLAKILPNESEPVEIDRGIIVNSSDYFIKVDVEKSLDKGVILHGRSKITLTKDFQLKQGNLVVPIKHKQLIEK